MALQLRKEIKIDSSLCEELDTFRRSLNLEGRPSAIQKLLEHWRENHSQSSLKIAAFDNGMSEQAPVCVTGLPGSGKSHTLNEFCTAASDKGLKVLLLDTTGERPSTFGKKLPIFRALPFNAGPGFWRVVPEADLRSRVFTVRRLFEYLSMLQVKGMLQDWCIVIDEANQFAGLTQFQNFLTESRKYCKKAVVASMNPKLFEYVCKPMATLTR